MHRREEGKIVRRFRVIQGGKDKPEEPREDEVRLYTAHSVGNLTRGDRVYHDVKFHWYCLERAVAPFPDEAVIADFQHLDEKQRQGLQRDVRRYFTAAEARALGDYLELKYGLELIVEPVELPIRERGRFFDEGNTVIYDFLELSEQDDYPLPFRVWGYYSIESSLTSPSLENGVLFLEKAFEMLHMTVGFDREQLQSVVKDLYVTHGLLVKQRSRIV